MQLVMLMLEIKAKQQCYLNGSKLVWRTCRAPLRERKRNAMDLGQKSPYSVNRVYPRVGKKRQSCAFVGTQNSDKLYVENTIIVVACMH
jgi:hypothetical protein